MKKRKKKSAKKSRKSAQFLIPLLAFLSATEMANDSRTANWKKPFFILLMVSLVAIPVLSTFSGINGDERFMVPYAEHIVEFYLNSGESENIVEYWDETPAMRYYGAGFELPAGALASIFGLEAEDRGLHTMRNILLALIGFLMVAIVGFIAKVLFNWRAAFFASGLLLLSPRFLGHAMINPRDIPFALGFIGSALFILLILKNIGKPRWVDVVGLAISIGFALSVRAGGALMLFMFFLAFYVGLLALNYLQDKKSFPGLIAIGKGLVLPLVAGFTFGILLWPYAISDPFTVVRESLDVFTAYPVSIRILFGGDLISSSSVPLSYLPTWISITIPLAFIAGLILFFMLIKRLLSSGPTYLVICMFVMFASPFAYVMYSEPGLYDGWRHFAFFYVAGVPIAAIGWEALTQWAENRQWKPWIIPVVLGLLMFEPAVHIARNYQFPYVYFNPLVGGVSGAFGDYELDYWGISTRQGVEELERRGVLHEDMEPIVLATNFRYGVQNWLAAEYRDKVKVEYVRYRERYATEWDYAIFVSRFMEGTHMKAVDWPGSVRVVKSLKVNNTPITAVYEKGEPHVFQGKNALDRGQISEAIQHLNQEIEYDPKNNLAYYYLGMAYLRTGNIPQAIAQLEIARKYSPDNQATLLNLGLAHINAEDYNEAKKVLHHLVDKTSTSYGGYYYLAMANLRTGDLSLAAQYIEQSVRLKGDFKPGYDLAVEIFEEMGDNNKATQYRNARARL